MLPVTSRVQENIMCPSRDTLEGRPQVNLSYLHVNLAVHLTVAVVYR